MSTREPRRIVIVGGGVSGLTTAYRLSLLDPTPDILVVDAGAEVGGKLRSVEVGGLQLPAGADSFLARKPWALDLCKELGIGDELDAPSLSGSYLWTDRGLVAYQRDAPFGIPGDVGEVFRWPGLSKAGRRRAAQDLVRRKRKETGDETLGSLLRRRLGDEATDLAVAPLLGGLFAGDVDRLSVQATFPELVKWEQTQGSLIRGSQAATRNARGSGTPGPMFLRPRGGVERLSETLAERIGSARRRAGTAVSGVGLRDDGYVVQRGSEGIPAEAVVLATEAHVSLELIRAIAPEASRELEGIPYASTGVVLMVYPEGCARDVPAGTGFVVPRGKAPMTASTWLSNKWPSEAFGTRAVVRSYVGAIGDEDVLDAEDDDIVAAVARFHAAALPLPAMPEHAAVVRWPRSMPQYELGHLDRVERIRNALPAGIFVTGQAYDGVGVPDCVRGAAETARAVVAHLDDMPSQKEPVP